MPTFIVLCISGLVLSLFIVGRIRQWATSHLLDIPNDRSSHRTPTPKGGGIGITGTVAFIVIPLLVIQAQWDPLVCVVSAVIIGAVGFIDDRNELAAVVRLLIQAIVTVVVVLIVGVVDNIFIPLVGIITLPVLLAIPVSIFWVLAVTNIYNFMDGIDGFAGTQAVVGGLAWAVFFWIVEEQTLAALCGVITASSLGFLYWNHPPARIFMGDVGSTFLGFSFAAMPLLAYRQLADPKLLLIGLLFIGPFLFDGTLTIVRRAVAGENVLTAHRSHLYQRLTKVGYAHGVIDLIYLPLMLLSALTGLALWYEVTWLPLIAILLSTSGIGLVVYVVAAERRHAMLPH